MYRVHFKWKEKEIELMAKSLDLTHPYFVSIKDIVLPDKPNIIINPAFEEVQKQFGNAYHLMIPFQTVSLIEELSEENPGKVRPFSILENGGKSQ